MPLYISDPYAAGPRLPVAAFKTYAVANGAQGPWASFIDEIVRVCPLLPTPLDDAIVCAQSDWETGTWSSSYFVNDGNPGGIGIYADGVPSPFSVPGNGPMSAHIFLTNIWLLLGYGPSIPSVVADVNNVSGLSSYFSRVNSAAKDPNRPRIWRIQDLNLTYTSSSGSSECAYACDPTYGQGIVQRFNGAVSAPNTHPATVSSGTTGTTTTTTTVTVTAGPDIGKQVVAVARQGIGCPYNWAHHGPCSTGWDCSGFTADCYAQVTGKWFTTGSAEQWDTVGWGVSRAALYPGDLLFFDTEGTGTAGHVGIWTGDSNPATQMVNAENPSVNTVYANPFDAYFAPIFLGAKRVYNPPAAGGTTTVKVDGTATTTDYLNLRAGPSTSDAIILTMPPGATVQLTGALNGGFYPVVYQGTAGWASATFLTVTQAPSGGTTTTTTGGNPTPLGSPPPPSAVKSPLTTWSVMHLLFRHTTFAGVDYTMPDTEWRKAEALLSNFPGAVARLSGNRCRIDHNRAPETFTVTSATLLSDGSGTHYVGPNDIVAILDQINASGYDHVFVYWPAEGIPCNDYAVTLEGAGGGYTAMKIFDTAQWDAAAETAEAVRQFMLEVGSVMQARNACRFPDLLNPLAYTSKGNLDYADPRTGLTSFLQDTMTGQLVEKASGLAFGMSDSAWRSGPPVTTNTATLPARPTDLPDDAVTFPLAVDTSALQPGDVLLVGPRAGVPFSATPTGAVLGDLPAGTRAVVLALPPQVVGGVALTNVATRYGAGWAPLGLADRTTAYPDWCLNPYLEDDLHGVVANEPTMDLTRAFVGEGFTAMAATWGVNRYEGIRFESGTTLNLGGGRTIVCTAEVCGVGQLDAVTTRLWSHRGPAIRGEALTGYEDQPLGSTVLLTPQAWQRVVVPAIAEDPTAPLEKVQMHLVSKTPLKQVFHVRGVHFIEL